jgi:hypothetical protein
MLAFYSLRFVRLRGYLVAIAKGKSPLALSRDLCVSYKTASLHRITRAIP